MIGKPCSAVARAIIPAPREFTAKGLSLGTVEGVNAAQFDHGRYRWGRQSSRDTPPALQISQAVRSKPRAAEPARFTSARPTCLRHRRRAASCCLRQAAIDRQRRAGQPVEDHQLDQHFRKLIGTRGCWGSSKPTARHLSRGRGLKQSARYALDHRYNCTRLFSGSPSFAREVR